MSVSGISLGLLQSTAPELNHETLGTRIRRKMMGAATKINAQPVCMAKPWQASEAVLGGARRVNGANVYVCVVPGTTAASGGPTSKLTGGVITDNSASWEYVGSNTVLQDPNTTLITWSAVLAVTAAQILVVGGPVTGSKVYGVVGAGNTGASAPTGTSNAVTDGTATLTYMGLWQANPYMATAPVMTTAGSAPGGYVYYSGSTPLLATSPVGVLGIVAKGSGYAVNDTITLTGGTFSQAAILTVKAVNSGGVTAVSLTTPGTYTVFPQSTVAQGSTSGGGTGCTVNLIWPDPAWIHINNGYVTGGAGGNNTVTALSNYNPGVGSSPKQRHISAQFQTDEPSPVFGYLSTGNCSNSQILYDDGNGWIRYNQDLLPVSGTTYITLAFPGGRKMRRFKIETGWNASSAVLPTIGVTASSVVSPLIDKDTLTCAAVSDSLFDGSAVSPWSCGFYFANQVGYAMDWNVWDFSQGGTGYINAGGGAGVTTNPFCYRIPQVLASNPNVVLLYGSTNDIGNTSQQMTNSVTSFLQGLRGTVPAWLPSTAYTLSQIVSNGGNWYYVTTAGTSASSVGPTGLSNSVTDGSVTWASLGAAPTTFFTGPIIVWGVESVSANALTLEGYISSAVSAFALVDPMSATYFVPFSNVAMPAIIGTYNNNPTPGGLTVSGVNNFSTYINGSDSVHPMEIAVSAETAYARNLMSQTTIPAIH